MLSRIKRKTVHNLVAERGTWRCLTSGEGSGVGVRLVADTAVNVIAANGSVITVFDLQTTFQLHFKVIDTFTSVRVR